MHNQLETLRQFISTSNYIVFFGGAGVSTESGIPDFRSVDGLYSQKYKYPPERIVSRSFFMSNTADYYDFHKARLLHMDAKPNPAHIKLAELEKIGKLKAVITQNIDGLHQSAGSVKVLELHGSVYRNFCMECGLNYEVKFISGSEGVPHCSCGGVIKPDVVLFEEALDDDVMVESIMHIKNADMLIIGGTSLGVYPAAGLLNYYRGSKLVLINKSETPWDERADLVINGSIGEVLNAIVL
ncbi:MAG: NAD-dependent protein deacylase [Defluviitaleaceae bacterium]|nr:NAD-dependent protein deacylase [Defluviitaleaceae bacterium]